MSRRTFTICFVLGFLAFALMLLATLTSAPVQAQALTSTRTPTAGPIATRTRTATAGPTATRTRTPTAYSTTPTFTASPTISCAIPDAHMLVAPVTSPSIATTQVINVTLDMGISVTITSEAGTFTSNTPVNGVYSIMVNLVENSTNHLHIEGQVNMPPTCFSYSLVTNVEIYQNASGSTPTLTPTVTPVAGSDLLYPAIPGWVWDPDAYDSANACYNYVPVLVWKVQIKNAGDTDTDSFVVSQNYDLQKIISGLPAGQTTTLYFPFRGAPQATAAAGQPTLPAGYSSFIADYTNLIAESNETNNTTSRLIPMFTATPTSGATRVFCKTPTPGTPTPSKTPTLTPGITKTPTPTISPTVGGGTCSPVTATITAPFTKNGAGTFCWQSSNLGAYINSWNLTSLTINGLNYTNLYVAASSYPAKMGGYWYVAYNGPYAWSHFEAK